MALAAAVRFWRLGHQSFWYDEGFTVDLVHHSFGQMLGQVPNTELTPPLYYCLAWVWARVFGYGEVGLRSLSAVAGLATIPAIYGAAAKMISRRAGLVAAALAACNPLLIWYSQEARSYALLVLFAALSLLAFAQVCAPHPTPRRLAAWALAAGLTLATHYYGALAVIPQALWLLWVHRWNRRVLLAITAVGAVGLALLPTALTQRHHANWIADWALGLRLGQILPQFLLGTGAPSRPLLKLVGGAAIVIAAAMLVRRARASEQRGALLAGALGVSGFVISLILILFGVDELITRNMIVVLIPLIVLLAAGLGTRRAGPLGLAGTAMLCTIGLTAAVGVAVTTTLQRPDWREVAQVIRSGRSAQAGRAILLQNYTNQLLPLRLYLPEARRLLARAAVVEELDVVALTRLPNVELCWWGSACNLVPSELDRSLRLPGFQPDGRVVNVGQFSILRLRSTTGVRLRAAELARALTTTRIVSDTLLIEPPV